MSGFTQCNNAIQGLPCQCPTCMRYMVLGFGQAETVGQTGAAPSTALSTIPEIEPSSSTGQTHQVNEIPQHLLTFDEDEEAPASRAPIAPMEDMTMLDILGHSQQKKRVRASAKGGRPHKSNGVTKRVFSNDPPATAYGPPFRTREITHGMTTDERNRAMAYNRQSAEAKVVFTRLKNNASAARSRARNKAKLAFLENRVGELQAETQQQASLSSISQHILGESPANGASEAENVQLRVHNTELRTENGRLREELAQLRNDNFMLRAGIAHIERQLRNLSLDGLIDPLGITRLSQIGAQAPGNGQAQEDARLANGEWMASDAQFPSAGTIAFPIDPQLSAGNPPQPQSGAQSQGVGQPIVNGQVPSEADPSVEAINEAMRALDLNPDSLGLDDAFDWDKYEKE